MKVNISDLLKNDGSVLDLEFNDVIEELNSVVVDYQFNSPVNFTGKLVNASGILKLDGHLRTEYTAKCYRCLENVNRTMSIDVKENILNAEKNPDTENFTYEGNFILLDKVLTDNVILNLPMRQVCKEDCKGLCPKCGNNFNEKVCQCREDTINPKMEILKNFFNN